MNKIEAALILFGILFVIIFLVDFLVIKRGYLKKTNGSKKGRKSKKKKNNELTEISYLISKFNLDKEKLPLNKVLIVISLINALIISFVAIMVIVINIHIILQLIIGFILLIALIYALYEILGRYLVKKGFGK